MLSPTVGEYLRSRGATHETRIFADSMPGWYDQLVANIRSGDTRRFNDQFGDPGT